MMMEAEPINRAREMGGNIQLNPFMLPPVLEVLFKHLSMEDLAGCRLVSKLWYKESLSAWRPNAALKFSGEEIVSTREDGSIRTTSLGEFLDLWEAGEWGSCPFNKFNLSCWYFKPGGLKHLKQDRFMELVGCHVTSLTLVACSFDGREDFQRIIYQAFPKLQFLKINDCDVNNFCWFELPEEDKEILEYEEPAFGVHGLKSLVLSKCRPLSMMDMLSHFHKLESLHMDMRPDILSLTAVDRDYRDLLETIRLIRAQDPGNLPLKDFDAEFEFKLGRQQTASSIELLELHDQLKLPLQRLSIYFDPMEEVDYEVVIRDTLQYHSSTLKHLKFSGDGRHGLCKLLPFGFHLEKLEKLDIHSPGLSDSLLNYLKHTPNLRVLKIYAGPSMAETDNLFSTSSHLEIDNWTLASLTDLRLSLPLSICNLRKLMKWMPNVERLFGIKLNDTNFSLVCKHWKNLKEIWDCGYVLTDEGVLGIGNGHESGADDEGTTQKSCPNIANLKNLTSFETWSSQLTSASVCQGFLKLANLKWLTLGNSTKLNEDTKAAIKMKKIRLNF